MGVKSKVGNWMFVIGTIIGVIMSLLVRDRRTRDGAPKLREQMAEREREVTSDEADRRRARAVAARDKLRKRSSKGRRHELLRRVRGSKRGGS